VVAAPDCSHNQRRGLPVLVRSKRYHAWNCRALPWVCYIRADGTRAERTPRPRSLSPAGKKRAVALPFAQLQAAGPAVKVHISFGATDNAAAAAAADSTGASDGAAAQAHWEQRQAARATVSASAAAAAAPACALSPAAAAALANSTAFSAAMEAAGRG
jgi:hypothetical protein